MKMRWLLGAVAMFSLVAYLGVWGYSMVAAPKELPEPLSLEQDEVQLPTAPQVQPQAEMGVNPKDTKTVPEALLEAELPEERKTVPQEEGKVDPPKEAEAVPEALLEADPITLPETPIPLAPRPREEDLVRKVGFEMSTTSVDPGGLLVLSAYGISNPGAISVNNPFGVSLKFYPVDDHLVALLPVKYTYEPGQYLLFAEGGGYQESFTLTVRQKTFPTQHLQVDQGTVNSTIGSNAANDEYYAKVQPIKFMAEEEALWQGQFLLPVKGARVTTEFGMQRITNGQPGDRHGGIDLAASTGTQVSAANRGMVVFSEQIAMTGNTICIDHGMGLKSWYYHMDSLSVRAGEMVKKGDPIGTVGSTGFSTGPHLHFATSVWNIYIDPNLLIKDKLAVS